MSKNTLFNVFNVFFQKILGRFSPEHVAQIINLSSEDRLAQLRYMRDDIEDAKRELDYAYAYYDKLVRSAETNYQNLKVEAEKKYRETQQQRELEATILNNKPAVPVNDGVAKVIDLASRRKKDQ
jgi:hypothetical protein